MSDTTSKRLLDYSLQGLVVFSRTVPGILWTALKGCVAGFFILGLVGLAMAGGVTVLAPHRDIEMPTWLVITTLVVTPVVLALVGGYIGAMRGLLSALAAQLAEKRLLHIVYAFARPVLVKVAADLRGGSEPVTRVELLKRLRAASQERVGRILAESPTPPTLGERLQRWLALQLQNVLVAVALAPAAEPGDREAAIEALEETGVAAIEEAVVDSLEGLYDLQFVSIMVGALLIIAIPHVVYALTA